MIIGICGVKRCGKDTIANRLCAALPFDNKKIAGPLKEICGKMFDWSGAHMEEDIKDVVDPRWGVSPREALQFFGTEMMQYKIQELLPTVGRNFWITKLLNGPINNMVISDLRFVHEYDMIKKVNPQSIIIKVVKPGGAGAREDNHSSEMEWSYIKEDLLIINDGTLEELHDKVDKIIQLWT